MGPENKFEDSSAWADAFAELGDSFKSSSRKAGAGEPPTATSTAAVNKEFGVFNRLDLSKMGE